MKIPWIGFCLLLAVACAGQSIDVKKTDTFRHIKAHIDSVPDIDTHDHLKPFPILQGTVRTDQGVGMTLFSMWNSSYFTWIHPVTPWPESGRFDEWWPKANYDFTNARATSFYRYQLSAFTDLYGVDFETLTEAQARDLNRRIFANYRSQDWLKAGKASGGVCLKTTVAYERTLQFDRVPKDRAAKLYGRSKSQLTNAQGIYGGTEFTRRCLAKALAEKVERGELREDHALRLGTQVMPDNALELFPQLKDRLWKQKGKLKPLAK